MSNLWVYEQKLKYEYYNLQYEYIRIRGIKKPLTKYAHTS